jgi:hypothetical protein
MKIILALLAPTALVALYFFVIRPRGARMLETYRSAGGGWAGVKAALVGFQTIVTAFVGAIAYALPELLTVASGADWKSMLPEPWGGWCAFGVAVALPLMRALMTTPSGQPPSGEA